MSRRARRFRRWSSKRWMNSGLASHGLAWNCRHNSTSARPAAQVLLSLEAHQHHDHRDDAEAEEDKISDAIDARAELTITPAEQHQCYGRDRSQEPFHE